MWQISRIAIPWLPSALALMLLSACSSGEAPPSGNAPASPPAASEQTAPTPDANPSPVGDRATPAASPSGKDAPSPSSSSAPTRPRAAAHATKPAVKANDRLDPTYRAEERMAGFSPDGRHYLYLESSRDTGAGIPKSSLQVVDVASNACEDNGCLETQYQESDAKLKTSDAENDLLKKTWKVRQDLKLTPPIAGRVLPIVARSQTEDGSEVVTVQLEQQNQPLQLRLRQKQITAPEGATEPTRAAMQLEVSYKGQTRSLDSLDHFRDWVTAYSIREVHLSPDGSHVAVLVTATRPTFEGTLGTTIVQGFKL